MLPCLLAFACMGEVGGVKLMTGDFQAWKNVIPVVIARRFVPGEQSSQKRLVLHGLEAVECCE